jgi:uncharacterized membrane protein HdeD (DUF308 family)
MKGRDMRNEGYFDIRTRVQSGIEELSQRWGWYFALGAVLLILGVFAASYAYLTTVASVIIFGWVLLFAGGTLCILSFLTGKWSGFLLSLAAGILSLMTGVMLLRAPLSGAASLTLVIAVFLGVAGIFRAISSIAMQFPNWGWSLLSGVVAIILSGALLASWPVISVWFLGFYVGIDLIVHGFAWSMFALSLRSMSKELDVERRTPRAA